MTSRVGRLGLPPLTPHGLRHTHATALLSANVPGHVVQQRLGHESSQITLDDYAHVLPGDDRGAAERFASLLTTPCDQNVTAAAEVTPASAS